MTNQTTTQYPRLHDAGVTRHPMTTQTLTGSAKQVAWATEIRERALPVMRRYVADAVEATAATSEQAAEAVRPLCDAWISRLEAETDASWWITNQSLAHDNGGWVAAPAHREFHAEVRRVARASQ